MVWAVVQCPPTGHVAQELLDAAELNEQPWRNHALCCLKEDIVLSSRTYIITGTRREQGIIASAWLSLPDPILLAGELSWAFIFNVFVRRDFRHQGMGSEVTRLACVVARRRQATGVMLATGDNTLRTQFYNQLGFRPVDQDPWLLSVEFPKASDGRLSRTSRMKRHVIRRRTAHDLATVQSICAQPHWICKGGSAWLSSAQECEEDFCESFRDCKINDFLISGKLGKTEFVSWMRQNEGQFQQCVVIDQVTENEVHQACREALRLLHQTVPHDRIILEDISGSDPTPKDVR